VSARSIVGVILAAGQSSRMGRPKALLRIPPRGDTFLERIISTFRRGGLADLVVVGRPDDQLLRAELTRIDPSIPYVVNPAPERGQLSSLVAGIDAAESRGAAGVLVLPVDIPLVRHDTIATLLAASAEPSATIVRPGHQGRHGHPVVFTAALFGDVRSADMAVGAKAVVHRHAGSVRTIEVDDPGILRDVDEPRDYRDLFNADPAGD
jgi:molybdenum cofactor cytidylyltransferase